MSQAPIAKPSVPAVAPPSTGAARLPLALNGSIEVNAKSLAALYLRSERGATGFFPLGDGERFHSGAHLAGTAGEAVFAIADGELVAARMSRGPGLNPWGDTGFVLLRHTLLVNGSEKIIYSLYVSLRREPLHPGTSETPWVTRFLADSLRAENTAEKWRVLAPVPTWPDAAKGSFSPEHARPDKPLEPGVYEQEDELTLDHKRYVKLSGQWVRGTGGHGDEERLKPISKWAAWDIRKAGKAHPLVAALESGQTALFDSEKDESGNAKWRVRSGERIGALGMYLGAAAVHVSVFSQDEAFPTGAMAEEDYGLTGEAHLTSLDVAGLDADTPEHVRAFTKALDPERTVLEPKPEEDGGELHSSAGAEHEIAEGESEAPADDGSIVKPSELREYYGSPQAWRARYLAVTGLTEFRTDVEELLARERPKRRSWEDQKALIEGASDFLFWKDLSDAENFPSDGKAIFVHPITAIRLMSTVLEPQAWSAPAAVGGSDRLHANDDVLISMRDGAGPVAGLDVTVIADGQVVKHAKTDSAGELLVPLEAVANREVLVEVSPRGLGPQDRLLNVVNETGGPVSLEPGVAPSRQPFNGLETLPRATLLLAMQLAPGRRPTLHGAFNEGSLAFEKLLDSKLTANETVTAERILFRSADGAREAVEATRASGEKIFLWSVEDGVPNLIAKPDRTLLEAAAGKPILVATWSAELAHLNDHPIFAGRVFNADDGLELEVTFFAMRAIEAPEYDEPLGAHPVTLQNGGFAVGFEPGPLALGSDLLASARPVFAKVSLVGSNQAFTLRSQAIAVHANRARLPTPAPEILPKAVERSSVLAFFQLERDERIDAPTTWDGQPAASRTLSDIHDAALQDRLIGEGGWDRFTVGPITTGQHLALESQRHLSPAQALAEQEAGTRGLLPDAPAWLFSKGAQPWAPANGIAMGLCASHCAEKLNDWGVASGCTEAIRVSNLASCQHAHHAACQTIKPPAKGTLKVIGTCAQEPEKCGEARHDKSHCFLAQPIPGANGEERERWHLALPLRAQDEKGRYPYLGSLKILVMNPLNGNAVVCSQESRGPASLALHTAAAAPLGIQAGEFNGQPHLASVSPEAAWKLGLNRSASGDAIALLAFVSAATPLGPVHPDKQIKLRKQLSHAQLLGQESLPGSVPPPWAVNSKKEQEQLERDNKQTHPLPHPAMAPVAVQRPSADPRPLAKIRLQMIELAQAELGKIDDRGGEKGQRKGWPLLQEILEQATGLSAEKGSWLTALQTPGQRAGGLKWSALFAVYLAKKIGLKASWDLKKEALNGLGAVRYDEAYVPGDVLVLKGSLREHCVLIGRAGDKLTTISGDGPFQTIELRMRRVAEIEQYFRLSPETFSA
jgi:hypothetical protein